MAGRDDFEEVGGLYRGDTFTWTLEWRQADGTTPFDDLTGYTFRSQFKNEIEDTTPLFELSIGSGITVDTGAADITLTISNSQAELFGAKVTYDVEATSPAGVVTTLTYGNPKVTPDRSK